jgi:hypothetical protein
VIHRIELSGFDEGLEDVVPRKLVMESSAVCGAGIRLTIEDKSVTISPDLLLRAVGTLHSEPPSAASESHVTCHTSQASV